VKKTLELQDIEHPQQMLTICTRFQQHFETERFPQQSFPFPQRLVENISAWN